MPAVRRPQWIANVAGLALMVLFSPILLLVWIGYSFQYTWLAIRLRLAWPRGKFALVAYTDSPVWGTYIEETLLPSISAHCVIVNRSTEGWKRAFRVESRALSFWGRHLTSNPIALVLLRSGRVRVFHFHDAFLELKHGRPSSLESIVSQFVQCIHERVGA